MTPIRGAQTEDSTIKEGTVTYDIRFYAVVPRSGEMASLILSIEAQNDFYPGYPIIKRGIYYCSRMISSQYGVEFVDNQYEKICKVYSIWICANPPKYWENTINRYVIHKKNWWEKWRRKLESEVSAMCNLSKGIEEKGICQDCLFSGCPIFEDFA